MINDIEEFIKYFHGQRRRTQWVVDCIPEEKAHWRPWPGEPSPSELVCRIAAGHLMYARAVAHDHWEIDQYETAALEWGSALAYFEEQTETALDLLRPLNNNILRQKRRKPEANIKVQAWRFLMAMLDHEISHRSQLDTYLMLLNVRQPRLDATSIEAIRASLEK